MSKQKLKTTNWSIYNNALRQPDFLIVCQPSPHGTDNRSPERRGRPLHYTDMAITTVLMMKRVFNLSLRALWDFVNSIFTLMKLSLRCPDYSLVSRRAKTVNINITISTRGEIAHLVIDGIGLKVCGEGEWKVKQHGAEHRRVWRKLHLAVDSATHEVICADLSLSGTTDALALPGLISQTHRKIRDASADGTYDIHYCHYVFLRKTIRPLIPPRKGAKYYWADKYSERNHAVANQRLSGILSLRYYNAQVGEAMAMVKALNRMMFL